MEENFSVYNVNKFKKRKYVTKNKEKNPLQFLMPESNETGWHVSRNLLKPLNHLDFLRRKEIIAELLNLHNLNSPREIFDVNYKLLELHQQSKVSTDKVIEVLESQLLSQRIELTANDIRSYLRECATVRHMEFHPSDVCNLKCIGCTYGFDNPETKPAPINFPFDKIYKISKLKPKSMVIIGGGEPTLYKSRIDNTTYWFNDVVKEVRNTNPDIKLALVTNGTVKPEGDWPNYFSWLRISLDAATKETYESFRRGKYFEKVIENFLDYLDSDVPHIGIGFLFSKYNIHEYVKVAEFVYNKVKEHKPHHLHKVNIQYRPLRRDPRDYNKNFDEAVTYEQIEKTAEDIKKLANESKEIENFLRDQTNITAILGGNSHPPHEFSRCHYSQTFKIVRANGDLRPCFIRVVEPDFLLGNIVNDSLETIALNTLYIGAIRKKDCNSHGCRQCHVNYTFEKGLHGELKPSDSLEVLADPMY